MSLLGDALRDTGSDSDGLGFFNTEVEAEAARLSVQMLDKIYAQAGSPARWKPQVDAVDAEWKRYDDSTVFYTFAQALAIGQRAQALAQQIATEAGISPPASDPNLTPSTTTQLADAIATAGKIAAGIGVAALAWKLYELAKPEPTIHSGPPPLASNPRRRRRRRSKSSLFDKVVP